MQHNCEFSTSKCNTFFVINTHLLSNLNELELVFIIYIHKYSMVQAIKVLFSTQLKCYFIRSIIGITIIAMISTKKKLWCTYISNILLCILCSKPRRPLRPKVFWLLNIFLNFFSFKHITYSFWYNIY